MRIHKENNRQSISGEATLRLLREYKENHSMEIRNEIVSNYYYLVNSVAKSYANYTGISIGELESYGSEGLILAVEKFDVNNGNSFIPYALSYIKGYILRGIPEIQGFSRGVFFSCYVTALRIVEEKYNQSIFGNIDMLDEVCELIKNMSGLSQKSIANGKKKILFLMSDTIKAHKQDTKCIDDNSLYKILDDDYTDDLRKDINLVLGSLRDRDRKVIELRYGLNGNEVYSCNEVAAIFHVSDRRIRKIEQRVLRTLRYTNIAKVLSPYLEYDCSEYDFNPAIQTGKQKCK